MSSEELDTILSFMNPEDDVVSLLGGEPTLHSRFKEIVERVCDDGYNVKIFTNGATAGLRDIHGIAPNDVKIILNLNMPDTYNSKEWEQIEKNCKLFKEQIALSFNVYRPDFSWDYLKSAILDWQLFPFIRIGMAQPINGIDNAYLKEEDMREASANLVAMAEDLANHGISLGFDCGFRTCNFTQEELGILAECGANFLFACKPVIDIGPGLMTWRCFPFSVGPGVKLTDFESLKEIEQYFVDKWSDIQQVGNTEDCGECRNLKLTTCSGGCLSRSFLKTVA